MKKIKLTDENYKKCGSIKNTSIRLGIKDFTVGPSLIENVDNGDCKDCLITKVELMNVKDLDHRHALSDGFHSLDELIRELRKHYPSISAESQVTIVSFKA